MADYLTKQHVPAPLRDELPLLVSGKGETLVAVIGYDVAAAFSASVETATHLLALSPLPNGTNEKGQPTIDAENAENAQ